MVDISILDQLVIEKCKTRAAISCKFPEELRHKIQLDLGILKKKFPVKSDAGIALVIGLEGLEVIVHRYGELVFKTTDTNQIPLIRKIADKIYKVSLHL